MKKQKGFSLIELLIVVGIIGALTAIAVPAYQSFQEESTVTAGVASLKAMRTVVEQEVQSGTDFPNGHAAISALGEIGAENADGTMIATQDGDTTTAGVLEIHRDDIFIAQYSRAGNGLWECNYNSRSGNMEIDGCIFDDTITIPAAP